MSPLLVEKQLSKNWQNYFQNLYNPTSQPKEITGREMWEKRFRHTYNIYPINRMIDYSFGDHFLEFAQDKAREYEIEESCRNLLIDGWLFEIVDNGKIGWMSDVDSFTQEMDGAVVEVVQKWVYEDGTAEYRIWNKNDLIVYTIYIEGEMVIEGPVIELDFWPIAGVVFNFAHSFYLEPVVNQLFRLDDIYENVSQNNDKHAKDPLVIKGVDTDDNDLQEQFGIRGAKSVITLPSDADAFYPKIANNAQMQHYELENLKQEILATLNIVDTSALTMSGVSRRIAIQPMSALAKRLRGKMADQVDQLAVIIGSDYVLSYGSLEQLEPQERKIELETLDSHKDMLTPEQYKQEVHRILDIF